jgi:hypothetical protein
MLLGRRVTRLEGAVLLAIYITYIVLTVRG